MGKLSGIVPPAKTAAVEPDVKPVGGKLSGIVPLSAETAKVRRAALRDEQNVFENLYDDAVELPTNVLRAGKHFAQTAVEQAQRDTWLNPAENLRVFDKEGVPAVANLVKANVESIVDTVKHPLTSLHNEPLMTVANVASLGTVGGAAANAIKNAGRAGSMGRLAGEVLQAVSPVPLPSPRRAKDIIPERIVDDVALNKEYEGFAQKPDGTFIKPNFKKTIRGITTDDIMPSKLPHALAGLVGKISPTAASWLLDPTANISREVLDELRLFQDAEPQLQAKFAEALRSQLDGVNEADRLKIRDLLAAEDARAILPDMPKRVEKMQRHLAAPAQPSPMDNVVPRYDDNEYVSDFVQVENALKHRPVSFIDKTTGKDLGGLEFMLGEKALKVDPANIDIVVNKALPQAADAERLKDKLLSIRQTMAQLSKDANEVNVGDVVRDNKVMHDQRLLGDAAYSRHLALYMPDVQKSGKEAEGLGAALSASTPSSSASPFSMATLKHDVPFAKRQEYGATTDLEYALTASASAAIHETMRYKLFDTLAKRAKGVDQYKVKGDRMDVIAADDYQRLVKNKQIDPERFKLIERKEVADTGMQRYGALAGQYVSVPLWHYLHHVDQLQGEIGFLNHAVFKTMRRFRNAWASSKVIGNLPSHLNNIMGNVLHQVVDGGVLGAADFAGELGKSVARGFAGLRAEDKYYRAAVDAGLINTGAVREVDNMVAVAMRREGFFKGIQRGVDEVIRKASAVKATVKAAKANPKAAAKAALSPMKAYEYVARDNALMQGLGKLFSGVENAHRLAILKRFADGLAWERGVPVEQLLADASFLKQARQRIERYSYRYDDVPLAIQAADRHGLGVFARYGWKSVLGLADAAATNPTLFRTAQNAQDKAYDDSSKRDRRMLDVQAPYTKGRVVPLSDKRALAMTYWSPYSLPGEAIGIKPKGTYDSGYFNEASVFDPLAGPLQGVLKIAANEDPMTGDELANGRLSALVDLMAPGQQYHLRQKLLPVVKTKDENGIGIDKRGRQLSLSDAILQNLGVRVEQRQDGRVEQGIERSYSARVNKIHQAAQKKLKAEPDPAERKRIIAERDEELAAVKAKMKRLLR